MALFCENCGNPLSKNSNYCENCGCLIERNNEKMIEKCKEPISVKTHDNLINELCFLFANNDWDEKWRRVCERKERGQLGILLTNTTNCPKEQLSNFYCKLEEYILTRTYRNAYYYVLDMNTQRVKKSFSSAQHSQLDFVISTLQSVCRVGTPQYLMVVGDCSTIASARWKNPMREHNDKEDEYVDSDLPYATLDLHSPFEKISPFCLSVGRIPSLPQSGFEEAIQYMEHSQHFAEQYTCTNAFVMAAREWEKVSRTSFEHLTPDFYTCPSYSFVPESHMQILDNNEPYNLLCFNLHGSNNTDYWYCGGENGVQAFDTCAYAPQSTPTNERFGYILASEACYGAKPMIKAQQSILMTAIQNRCLGFVGSSQIAYGMTDRSILLGDSLCLADIVVSHFSKYVAQGYREGDSFIAAMVDMLSSNDGLVRDEHRKTLATFALYGDPSVALLQGTSNAKNYVQMEQKDGLGLHIKMPDIKGRCCGPALGLWPRSAALPA